MDVEMFFVKTRDVEPVADIIRRRLGLPPDDPGQQPNWGLPNSYDTIVAGHADRRVAISPVVAGWLAAVESKEVLDFELLRRLSDQLKTDVLAIQLSDVTASCGYAWCLDGYVLEQRFMGDTLDPYGTIRRYLRLHRVTNELLGFDEALQSGWRVVGP